MTSPSVRNYRPEDADTFLALVQGLAEYEQLPGPDTDARARLVADVSSTPPRFELRLAEVGERVVGYAAFFMTYSTFLARPSLFLEDLFVLPDARGQGAGSALFDAVVAEARGRGCGRMERTALAWNAAAIAFYKARGARHLDEWHLFRLDCTAMELTLP
jgi:GNAT superfamily N-acetyltransferase